MANRIKLHEILKQILGSDSVYFQPPESLKMVYPSIRYEVDDINTKHANDRLYSYTKRYSVTVIDKNPDSAFPEKILELPMCDFNRFYTADNLNHWVFSLYF